MSLGWNPYNDIVRLKHITVFMALDSSVYVASWNALF